MLTKFPKYFYYYFQRNYKNFRKIKLNYGPFQNNFLNYKLKYFGNFVNLFYFFLIFYNFYEDK